MKLYGFEVHSNGTATLSLMTRVAAGKGTNGTNWNIKDLRTGPKTEIIAECERLNRQIAENSQESKRLLRSVGVIA